MPALTPDQLAAQDTVLGFLHAEASAAEERRVRAENAVAATSDEFGHLSALMGAHTLRTDTCLKELAAARRHEIQTALDLRKQIIEFRSIPGNRQKVELIDSHGRVVDRLDLDPIG